MARKLSRWEPFRDMVTLREAMDRLFEESFVRPETGYGNVQAGPAMAVDVYETEESLVVKAAVPGIKADELDITVTGDVLTIKGETKHEDEIADEHYHRREFRYGAVCRSVRLPIEVDVDKADASFSDGVLSLIFPKPEEKKPTTISVKVK